MNITLKQLRAFVAVSQTGNFTTAAEHLCITQSALSGLIKEMEQSLGLRLFDRSTRRTHLSKLGQDLYPLIEKILVDLDSTFTHVHNLKMLNKGIVRVAAPQLLSCTLLPEVIAAYHQQYPLIEVNLIDSLLENVTTCVLSGEVDFGVGPERDVNSDIHTTPFFELPFVAAFPPTHALAKKKTIRWADLANYPLITLQGKYTERLSLDLHKAFRDQDLNPSQTVTFMSTALSMAGSGLGVTTCLPYAASLGRRYGLTTRPLIDPVIKREFFIYTKSNRSLSPAAQSFHDFLFEYIHDHDDFK